MKAKETDNYGLRMLTPEGIFQVGLTLGDGPEDVRDAALLALELSAPLSREQLAGLLVEDVMRRGGVARDTFRATVCGETLDVPIFPVVGAAVERWVDLRRIKFRSPLFSGRGGRMVRCKAVGRWVKSRLAAAGIEGSGIGFEVVRNTSFAALNFGVLLARKALRVKSSIKAVRRYIDHPLTAADFAPLEELARLLLDARKLDAEAKREEAAEEDAGPEGRED